MRGPLGTLVLFWRAMLFYLRGGALGAFPALSQRAQVHLYCLCKALLIYDLPHYRHGTWSDDVSANLRNVAVPGTGVPLSLVFRYRVIGLLYLLLVYPLIAFLSGSFEEQLLEPRDWFTFWRMNCLLATLHCSKNPKARYSMEDKQSFLDAASEAGIAVSPGLDVKKIIVKHRNEEGGMGIHVYLNSEHGGDWIIQEVLENDEALAAMLPENAPLSTFRLITASSRAGDIETLSGVWRAGRAGADTDHSSILFDFDLSTGTFLRGTTNAHWYQLGPKGLLSPWSSEHDVTHHPDSGARVFGESLGAARASEMKALCEQAHAKLCPQVPLCGWDVALTTQGMCLLEVNLSCNFFRGTFDESHYFAFLREHLAVLQ